MITMSFLTVLAILLVIVKLPRPIIQRLIENGFWTDLAITVGIFAVFAYSGTVSGSMLGTLVGLWLSIILIFAKKILRWSQSRPEKKIRPTVIVKMPDMPKVTIPTVQVPAGTKTVAIKAGIGYAAVLATVAIVFCVILPAIIPVAEMFLGPL